ncbi:hypothetical protein GCM10007036_21440 [Alsobacter metallidurans]|uniref:Uncharacterized protein n=1 Tax=Alsobacter metallidurans TaxID=340221 RepID=A0A917I884_9HYPH|nr:hypothetical protein GCM10007036_21440 [Alsobacter metallidurans]
MNWGVVVERVRKAERRPTPSRVDWMKPYWRPSTGGWHIRRTVSATAGALARFIHSRFSRAIL